MAAVDNRRWHPAGAKEVDGRPEVRWLTTWPVDRRRYRVTEVKDPPVLDWDDEAREAWGDRWERESATPEGREPRSYMVPPYRRNCEPLTCGNTLDSKWCSGAYRRNCEIAGCGASGSDRTRRRRRR
jgi:hypothetical protein